MIDQAHIKLITENVNQTVQFTDEQLTLFASMLSEKKLGKREYLLRAGDICAHQSFVVSGVLKVFYADADGNLHNVKFASEGWWALDLESFTLATSAFYFIQALEDTHLIQISKKNYERLLQEVPQFEKFFRLQFQNAYILIQQRMAQNLHATAEEKYEHFRNKYPGLELRIPQKEIASYLGITPEFLSMIRKKASDKVIS